MATTEATLNEDIEVDWADLPADMLQNISKKLHDIAEFIYFRAVCKRWRTATSISDPPPLIPWLLQEPDHPNGVLRFYSLFSDKVRTVPCPQSHRKWLSGPSHGYLCAPARYSYDKDYYLVNPLTKHEVKIPITERLTCPIMLCMGPDPMKNDHMFFTNIPIETDEDENYSMGFYEPLSREWSYVEVPGHGMLRGEACLNGLFYLSQTGTGATRVVDIASGISYNIPPPPETLFNSDTVNFVESCSLYFVESAGKILRIVKKKVDQRVVDIASGTSYIIPPPPEPLSNSDTVIFFDIHQLDLDGENGQARWIKTSCIGDQVLFLDSHIGISVTATDSTGLKGNCIYYFERFPATSESSSKVRWYNTQACRYNIANGQSESTRCPFDSSITWFVPSVTGFLPGGPH